MSDRTEPVCGPSVSYTSTVRHLQRRVAGLVMIVALAGPQVLTAVCDAVCAPRGAHPGGHSTAGSRHGSSRPGDVTESSDRETLDSSIPAGGHHHGPTESVQRLGTPPTQNRIRGDRGSCCPDVESMPVVTIAGSRTDGHVPLDHARFMAVALQPLHRSVQPQLHGPPPAVASPAHRPLVLRI